MSAEEGIDLGTYLGVLDRGQLERLIVKMIVKDDSNFDLLVEVSHPSIFLHPMEPCYALISSEPLDAICRIT